MEMAMYRERDNSVDCREKDGNIERDREEVEREVGKIIERES